MADVGYHFANLWFAADRQNWPLAGYYLEQTEAHLQWAVRIRPVRITAAGAKVDLNGILESITNTFLKAAGEAIANRDTAGFRTAYRQTMAGCYGCHTACEKPFLRLQIPEAPGATVINFAPPEELAGGGVGDEASQGKSLFQQNCALCHASGTGPGNVAIGGLGPSLVGVVGRRAATGLNFNYTKALAGSGLVWDTAALDRFMANPIAAVPGTTMLISVPDAGNRRRIIAYLSTLVAPAGGLRSAAAGGVIPPANDPGDWRHAAPGVSHRIDVAALPAPFSSPSAGTDRGWWACRRRRSCPFRRASRCPCLRATYRGRDCCGWRPTATFSSPRRGRTGCG